MCPRRRHSRSTAVCASRASQNSLGTRQTPCTSAERRARSPRPPCGAFTRAPRGRRASSLSSGATPSTSPWARGRRGCTGSPSRAASTLQPCARRPSARRRRRATPSSARWCTLGPRHFRAYTATRRPWRTSRASALTTREPCRTSRALVEPPRSFSSTARTGSRTPARASATWPAPWPSPQAGRQGRGEAPPRAGAASCERWRRDSGGTSIARPRMCGWPVVHAWAVAWPSERLHGAEKGASVNDAHGHRRLGVPGAAQPGHPRHVVREGVRAR
mmetsp:Transcript_9444/g.27581  ORF Transcript_9444/g.27581 Transcript_9444/m.27581 type:complete len:275 (+) Transcript_9444:315-1139(+)